MKKLLLILALGGGIVMQAQDESTATDYPKADAKHELRLDAIELIASGKLEINYEYVINKYSGVGGFASVDLDNDDFDGNQKFAVGGFYRQYFFNKKDFGARGLFAEGFAQYGSYENTSFFYDANTDTTMTEFDDYGAVGLGFGLGQKWVSNNGFVLELSAGVGRNFGIDEEPFQNEYFFRGGILVGYRF